MVASQLDLLNRRISDLEARVSFLENVVTAAFQLVNFIGRRRHAPGALGDLIDAVRKQQEGETPPPDPTPTPGPSGPTDPSKPAT